MYKTTLSLLIVTVFVVISCSEKRTYIFSKSSISQFPTSSDTVKINQGEVQIATADGIRSDLLLYDSQKFSIAPKSTDTLLFKFLPINNLILYDRIGFYGDMDSVYTIALNFMHTSKGETLFSESIRFSLDKDTYSVYEEKYARENSIQLLAIKDKMQLKGELTSHITAINAVRNNKESSNNVEVSTNMIMIEGTIVRLSFYYLDSVLFLQAKVVNHGTKELNIKPASFLVKAGENLIKPQILSIRNSMPSQNIDNQRIIKSGRFEMEVKYEGVNTSDLALLLNDLVFYDINKALFPKPVLFVVDSTIY